MRARMIAERRNPRRSRLRQQKSRQARARHLEEYLRMSPIERIKHLDEHRECPEWNS